MNFLCLHKFKIELRKTIQSMQFDKKVLDESKHEQNSTLNYLFKKFFRIILVI